MSETPERIEVDRADLHKKAWAAPLPQVAQEMGVAEETLKRMCGLLDVPLPKRGHWMRSRTPRTRALPPRPRDEAQSLALVRRGTRWTIQSDLVPPRHSPKGTAAQIDGPHPLVRRAQEHYAHPALYASGLMKARSNSAPSLAVSESLKARALAFADALIKRLEAEGWSVSWRGGIEVVLPEGSLRLSLREEVEEVERPPTPEEAARDRGRLFYQPRRYTVKRPSGVLELVVNEYAHGVDLPRAWMDDGKRPLETRLDEIVRALPPFLKGWNEAKRKEEARQQAWREEMDRISERHRREALERSRKERLARELDAWDRAERIRAYAAALEGSHQKSVAGDLTADAAEWIIWMRQHADEMDPTMIEGGG